MLPGNYRQRAAVLDHQKRINPLFCSLMSAATVSTASNEEGKQNEVQDQDIVEKRLHKTNAQTNLINDQHGYILEAEVQLHSKVERSNTDSTELTKKKRKVDGLPMEYDDAEFNLDTLFEEKKNAFLKKKQSKKKFKPSKPNYFFAIRISNKDIHKKVHDIQTLVLAKNADFKPSFIPIPTLHLTLSVMTLKSKVEIEKAIDAMNVSLSEIQQVVENQIERNLIVEKLGNFNGQVVYLSVKDNDCLRNIVKEIASILQNNAIKMGVDIEKEKFNPHITIMKLSKCYHYMKKKGIKRIPFKLYESQKDLYFGEEIISEILLCSMEEKKGSDGFYKVSASLDLNKSKVSVKQSSKKKVFDTVSLSTYQVVSNRFVNTLQNDISLSEWEVIAEEEIVEAKHAVKNKLFLINQGACINEKCDCVCHL